MKNQSERLGMSRREMLASAGLAATGWMMLNNAAAADNPGVNVEDRGSSIRITGLKTYPIGGSRVLIKIETNREVFGWGEISQLVPKAAVALIESMFSLLEGENPTRVEHLWQKLYRAHRDFRGGAFMVHTISANDILQPDCAHGGGISQIRKIATLAGAYNTSIAPHSIASFLGVTASFHAAAAVPNFLIHELYPQGFDGILLKNWEVDKDGYASLPQGPGLGVEVDEVALAKVDTNKKFKWPGAKYPNGSIADY